MKIALIYRINNIIKKHKPYKNSNYIVESIMVLSLIRENPGASKRDIFHVLLATCESSSKKGEISRRKVYRCAVEIYKEKYE